MRVSRADVLRFRFHRHQLDRAAGSARDADFLDYGVQDTGPDGAAWALAARGVAWEGWDGLVMAWTLRGAPHAYRRAEAAAVAVATAPFSEADAAKRVFDASRPLKAAGIPVLDALREIAGHLRDIASSPTVKGEASSLLSERVGEPFLRFCRPCNAIHAYEQPFRLAALQGGLELEPGTSPPVLRRVAKLRAPRYGRLGGEADPPFHVVRNYLRFYGPARTKDAAAFVDTTAKDVKAQWPADAVEVDVEADAGDRSSGRWFALEEDVDELSGGGDGGGTGVVRLLGPFDPWLQLRDRELLVADDARRNDLWRTIGRPGGVVVDGEVVATWRPRTSGRRLSLHIEPWRSLTTRERAGLEEQAQRLAAFRGVTLGELAGVQV